MEILASICARAGSKGVKSKNIRPFLGTPIAYYTVSAFSLFAERNPERKVTLAVNTDSAELFEQLDRCKIDYIKVVRDESLAGDRVSKIDVIRDTLRKAQNATGKQFDVVLDMDLTSPLRRAVDVENILNALEAAPDADIALSLTDSRRSPYFNQLAKGDDGFYHTAIQSDFVARQQAPEIFDANASLYAYRRRYLLEGDGIFLKAKLAASFMADTAVLDIDCERDYELMQIIAEYLFNSDPDFGEVRDNIANILR